MLIDDAIDIAGYGRFHHILLVLSGLGFASSTMELVLPSLLLPRLIEEWDISATVVGTLMMGTFAGEVIGGLIWAQLSDRMGRRLAYIGTATLAAACAISSAACSDFSQLLVSRVGLGVALGGSMAIDFVYFLEFVPSNRRGSRATLIILVGIFGLFSVGLLGHFILPAYGWRAFLIACALPSCVLAVGRWMWPYESPRFLLSSGRVCEAEAVILAMANWNGRRLKEGAIALESNAATNSSSQTINTSNSIWNYTHLVPLIMAFGSVFSLHTFAYYGMMTWFGKFAAAYNLSTLEQSKGLMMIALAEVPGLFLSCWLIDQLGRRIVIAGNLFGAALTVLSMMLIPKDSSSVFLLATCASYFFIVGVWGGLYVYGPEVFPTAVRSTAFALCGTMGKFGGLVSPVVFGLLWDNTQDPIPHVRNLICACFTAAALLSLFVLKETNGSKMQ